MFTLFLYILSVWFDKTTMFCSHLYLALKEVVFQLLGLVSELLLRDLLLLTLKESALELLELGGELGGELAFEWQVLLLQNLLVIKMKIN